MKRSCNKNREREKRKKKEICKCIFKNLPLNSSWHQFPIEPFCVCDTNGAKDAAKPEMKKMAAKNIKKSYSKCK